VTGSHHFNIAVSKAETTCISLACRQDSDDIPAAIYLYYVFGFKQHDGIAAVKG